MQPGSVAGLGLSWLGAAADFDSTGLFSEDTLTNQDHLAVADSVQESHQLIGTLVSSSVPHARGASTVENTNLVSSAVGVARPLPLTQDLLALSTAHARLQTAGIGAVPRPVSQSGNPGQQTSTGGAALTPVVAAAPVASSQGLVTQVASTVQAQYMPNLQVTTTHVQGGPGTQSSPVWASYLGTPAEDRMEGIALDPANGNSVTVGFSGAAGARNLFVASLSPNGTSGTTAQITLGSNANGVAVAVDPSGTIYAAVTTDVNGPTSVAVVQISQDLSTASALVFNSTINGAAGGVTISGPTSNPVLTVSGMIDNNVLVASFTGLGSWPTPTQLYGVTIQFTDTSGNPLNSAAGNVGMHSGGIAIMAATVTLTTGDNLPGVVAFDGTTPIIVGFFNSTGAAGNGYGLLVDASDNIYFSGSIGPAVGQSEIIAATFDPNGTQVGGIAVFYQDGSGSFVNSFGYSVGITALAPNAVLVSRVAGDLAFGGGNMGFLGLDPVAPAILEDEGDAFGALDDQGRGIVVTADGTTANIAGATNSTDFTLTAGEFQPASAGGYDGLDVQYSIS
jgi:hypothetical protein